MTRRLATGPDSTPYPMDALPLPRVAPLDPPLGLTPGDVLLYDHRRSFFNFVIRHVSHAPVSHCETYLGNLQTVASRNGIGVNIYPFNPDGLVIVLRPRESFVLEDALAYVETVRGEKYDWMGLVRSFLQNTWGRTSTKQWCSENTVNVLRAGQCEPFEPSVPSDMIAPGDLFKSHTLARLWTAGDFRV